MVFKAGAFAQRSMAMGAPDIVTAIAAVATAFIAWRGLSVWKEQLRVKDDYELARRYLRALYDVREGFKLVRNPMIITGEFQQAADEAGLDTEPGNPMSDAAEAAVYDQRLKVLYDAWAATTEAGLDAEVLWQKPRAELTDDLRRLMGEMRSSLWRMLFEKRRDNPNMEALQAAEEVVYFQGTNDQFETRVDDAIKSAEKFLRKKLPQSK